MSGEENVKIRKKNRWTQVMLDHLIKLWGKYYPELKMNSRGHDKIYAKIIEELAMVGCIASMEDVRGRIHNLSGKYRKEAATEAATGRRSQWPYFYKIGKFFDYVVPAPVPPNAQPVLYDMSQYLELDYEMEDSLDLEGNGRVLIQEGELSDEDHLDDGLDEYEYRSDMDGWQSEHLEDGNNMEEGSAEEAEEHPLVEVLPDSHEPSIEPSEPNKDPFEPDKDSCEPVEDPLVPNNGIKVQTPPMEGRPSPEPEQQTVTQKEKEKEKEKSVLSDVHSDAASHTLAPKGKVYHLNSVSRQETIEDFLRVLYSNRLYTDVTIITCHNGDMCTIPAHRLVLANFSPHFSRIFENLTPAVTAGSVALILPPDVPHAVMQILLEYMYTGGTDVPGEIIDDVLRCGAQLKIRGFWSELRGEATTKRPTQSSDGRTNKKARLDDEDDDDDDDDSSSRSSTPSSPPYESIHPRTHIRSKPDDDEGAFTDVSSDIGHDLLRSDLDDEERDADDDEDDDDDDDDDEDDEDEDSSDDDDEDEDEEDENDGNEEDEDDDDDDDEDDDDDDDDDEMGDNREDQHRFSKQIIHKQHLMAKNPPHETKLQTTEERSNEEERIGTKRRLDTVKFDEESTSEQSESCRKRTFKAQAPARRASVRDQSHAENSLHDAAKDGVGKTSCPVKLNRRNLLSCRICSQRFSSVDEWLEHVVATHGSDPCLLGKTSTEHHITMLQCDLCQMYQESESSWLRHVLLKHAG